MKYFYGLLSVLGLVLPYSQFLPWVIAHGLDLPLLVQQASQSAISTFAGLDVLLSAVVLLGLIVHDGRNQGIRGWGWAVVGTLTVGVSFGLPLFLLLRERHPERAATHSAIAAGDV